MATFFIYLRKLLLVTCLLVLTVSPVTDAELLKININPPSEPPVLKQSTDEAQYSPSTLAAYEDALISFYTHR